MYLKIYYKNNVRMQPLSMISGTSNVTSWRIEFNQKRVQNYAPNYVVAVLFFNNYHIDVQ